MNGKGTYEEWPVHGIKVIDYGLCKGIARTNRKLREATSFRVCGAIQVIWEIRDWFLKAIGKYQKDLNGGVTWSDYIYKDDSHCKIENESD